MRFYLKADSRATIAAIKAWQTDKEKEKDVILNNIRQHNLNIMRHIYNFLKNGGTCYQKYRSFFNIFHPSSRNPREVTVSHFILINGKWEPTSHNAIDSLQALDWEIAKGQYITLIRGLRHEDF